MPEANDLADSWGESLGAGYSQGTPSCSSSHHLFSGAAAPCQSSPMTILTLSGDPSSCSSSSQNTHQVASTQQPPASSSWAPLVSSGDRPLTSEPPAKKKAVSGQDYCSWAGRKQEVGVRTFKAGARKTGPADCHWRGGQESAGHCQQAPQGCSSHGQMLGHSSGRDNRGFPAGTWKIASVINFKH